VLEAAEKQRSHGGVMVSWLGDDFLLLVVFWRVENYEKKEVEVSTLECQWMDETADA
jgi:hypothetical protein